MSWLGIDIGTTNTKVCLLPEGRIRTVPTPTDAAALQRETLHLIAEVGDGQRIEGVGLSGMAETGVPLGSELEPLTKLITWRDQPGVDQAARLAEDIGHQALFARTGLRLSAKLPVTTWRWLADTTSFLRRTRLWAGAPDLVLAALTGTYATHLTHAQRYGVLDLRRRTWDEELLAWGGLDRLPDIAEPFAITARTTHGVLPSGTPVVLCGHDHLVGAWAAGVREPGEVADSLGTSEAVVTPSSAPVLDDVLRLQGISSGWYADGRRGCAISGNGAAGGLVEQRLAYFDRDYRWLVEVLDHVGPPSDHVIAPYPNGRQAPSPDPTPRYDVRGAAADPAEEMRALVDALSYHARWMAEEQTRLLGIEWRSTVALGGPTRLDGWMRRKALASGGRDFAVVHGEATAAEGAALMAAEVVSGQPSVPLESQVVKVFPQLVDQWNGEAWHRFHKVVSEPHRPT
ncbi:xylulokinase [Kribbella amoyensis]|uniref:Xylulokinase n=1 Tax=Kribbella amoyensis TaxID=996641 RepID=A0A561BQS5_9ACTN|nr:FGGY family carbohydrate kinase [Kribbella amoyensis]TWD81230.1 xylulokinase [Kribbella amoyensis]